MRSTFLLLVVLAYSFVARGQTVVVTDASSAPSASRDSSAQDEPRGPEMKSAGGPAPVNPPGPPQNVLLPTGCHTLRIVTGVVPSIGSSSGAGYTASGDASGLTITFSDPRFTNPVVNAMPEATGEFVSSSTFIIQRTPSSVKLATSFGVSQNMNFIAMRCN
jgi:hypothetical protein